MRSSELDYELPPELIAQHPPERRDGSRLLVHDRASGETRHRRFDELPLELSEGTLVVVNDTRVLPARLRLERPGGGEAEGLVLEPVGPDGERGGPRPSCCCSSASARTGRGRAWRARRASCDRVSGWGRSSCSSRSAKAAGGCGSTAS